MLATLGICKLSLSIIQLSLGVTKPLIHPTVLGDCIATCKVVYKESKSGPKREHQIKEEDHIRPCLRAYIRTECRRTCLTV
jgi:hypothetical protein